MSMIRLGLTQRVDVVAARGERRDALDQAWSELLLGAGFAPVPLPNHPGAAAALVDELDLDGAILTGGNDLARLPGAVDAAPERDAFEAELLDACAERELPTLGVCRGMQRIVDHHGGRLARHGGHVGGRHPLQLVAEHRDWAERLGLDGRDAVNSFHGFAVPADGLGTELLAVATAPDGTVEALAHATLPRWGIMWHPERAPDDPRDIGLLRAVFAAGPARRRGARA